ncbi:MAG: RES family NAD+ phosphorylase [Deltaproteobacteria bacterium]|nr:RES family NAD+ phosphorylase [Deltaproteobacteria bacterium]
MIRAWRICRRIHSAFDGEGARLAGGRWNRPGTAVVYTSSTLSLAALELFVNVDSDDAPADLVALFADIPARLPMKVVRLQSLPPGWNSFPAPDAIAGIGSRWVRGGTTAVLAVPSAVVPSETNYLLNPAHRSFGRIRIGAAEAFSFDLRMWKH